jgi:hypothetical protein
MEWLRLVLILCVAGLMTACGGAGNFGSTGSGSNPGGGGSGSNPGSGGSGSVPAASLSPVFFPDTMTSTTPPALSTATLSNTGAASLDNIVPSITGTNPGDFALTTGADACGSTLAAESSCSIYVIFRPASATSFSATLSVADNASGSPQTAALSGTGINPCDDSSTSASFCCDHTIIWGGNTNGISASGGSALVPTGMMNQPRAAHTATLLADGTVLDVDGGQLDIDDLLVSIPSAEVFDPSQGKFSTTGTPCIARELHTATLLINGKVLITGGNQFSGYPTWLPSTSTAELYDPANRSFTFTGSMQAARTQHTATLLADGRVLIVGGSTVFGALASAEVYDPAAGSFVTAASLASSRTGHTATMLPSGKVLIVGGENAEGALASAELYDPTTNTFSLTGSMTTPRSGHTATLLANGKVLIAGGASSPAFAIGGIYDVASLPTAELYDPVTGAFSPAGIMTTGRLGHTATLLPNGRVLIAGGYFDYACSQTCLGYEGLKSAEIYDPVSGSFSSTDPMLATRFWHSATLLQDGSVLIAGGIGADLPLASAEIYK